MEPLHNCRIKRYPDGSAEIVVGAAPFGGGEVRAELRRYDGEGPAPDPDAGLPEPARRARRAARKELEYERLERDALQNDGDADLQENRAQQQRQARQRAQRSGTWGSATTGLSS